MKFKLDENLGSLGKKLLEEDGYDVMTVAQQKLSGSSDHTLYQVCREEERILVTLDHDFSHMLRFPPEATPGIVILESPGRLTPAAITARIAEMAALLRVRPIDRELWIVEPGRVRIRERRR
jgi:predicted nuclease of predicted toxin-antitoxin system